MSEVRLQAATPMWVVDDVHETVAYYTKVLGFRMKFTAGVEPAFALVERDGVLLGFSRATKPGLRNTLSQLGPDDDFADVYIFVEGVRDWYEQLAGTRGVEITSPLRRYHDGLSNRDVMVDFIITDPNGYRLAFGQRAAEVPGAEDIEEDWR